MHSYAQFFFVAAMLFFPWKALSLFHAITQLNLLLLWGFPVIIIISVLARQPHSRSRLHWPNSAADIRWHEWLLLITIILCLLTSLIVALISPPQTYDSLNYHMPRIAHWWQARSVGFFPTGIENKTFIHQVQRCWFCIYIHLQEATL